MNYSQKINDYQILLDSLDLSPFETLNAFNLRSALQKEVDKMNFEERLELIHKDRYLLRNINEFVVHLSGVYDFKESKEPLEEWWWHLDKVISGEINVKRDLDKGL